MERFVFSGDGHLREPKDLFSDGLPASLRKFGIHTKRDESYVMTYAGDKLVHKFPLRRETTTDENDPANNGRPNAKGAVDLDARMADMASEGIDAEIVFPTTGLLSYLVEDRETELASTQIYNDWNDQFLSGHLDTFVYTTLDGGERRLAFYVVAENRSNTIDDVASHSRRALAAGGSNESNSGDSKEDTINFSSDVLILSGRSPELVTKKLVIVNGPNGAYIDTAVNITVNAGVGREEAKSGNIDRDKIYVNDIENPGPGDVAFKSTDISGSGGTWTFRETLQRVEILNLSDYDIQINDIDVMADRQPLVMLTPTGTSDTMTLTFKLDEDASPTYIEIANTGDADILLNGEINNPIGVTTIVALNGSVLASAARPDATVPTTSCRLALSHAPAE